MAKASVKQPVHARTERGLMQISGGIDWDRELAINELREELTGRKDYAWAIASQEGWAPIGDFSEDAGFELMAMADGAPYEYATDNTDAAVSAATDTAATQSALTLTGAGLTVGIWDQGAVSSTHQELAGRVTIGDGSYAMNHPTHAGGTIAASGVSPTAQGMAPAIQLASHDWTDDLAEMAALAMSAPGQPNTIQISSHSYGFVSGWATSYSPPRWYGNAGQSEAANFGLYDWYAMKWDELCHNAPYYLPFKSSGNNRMDYAPAAGASYKYYDNGWQTKPYDPATDPAGDGDANQGFDSIPLIANAKNIMTVGAVEDAVTGGARDLGKANMTGFSGWGPTDDGRIKPDIVANGSILYSSKSSSDSAYGVMSGTSMSTPSAAGSAALLVELYNSLFVGDAMPASMIKALILHTADDLGNAGPDYRYGWGLMNTRAAAAIIEQHHANPNADRMSTATLTADADHVLRMAWDGVSPIRVTAAWTDPAAPYTYALDDRSPRLVHDIDIIIVDPNGSVHQPFLLDPENPNHVAITGDNNVDNVEQVYIASPAVEGAYEIIIRADGALAEGSQDYALVVTGLNPITDPPAVTLSGNVDVAHDGSGWVSLSGFVTDPENDGCALQVEFSADGGGTWQLATIAAALSEAGDLAIDNASETQILGLAVNGPSAVAITWDSMGGTNPVMLSELSRIRVRAWDGGQWSEWAETSPFCVDNGSPDMRNVVVTTDYRAFDRYVASTSINLTWTQASDESGVAGYFVSVNSGSVEDAQFTAESFATVKGLLLGQDNRMHLWALDTAGNLSDPVTVSAFVLDPAGTWNGGKSADGQSRSEVAVDLDSLEGNPVLRWQYASDKTYTIETSSTLNDPDAWEPVSGLNLTIDNGSVIWLADESAGTYVRVLAEESEDTTPADEEEPPTVEPTPAPAPAPTPNPAPIITGQNLFIQWLLTMDRNIWWVNFLLIIFGAI